MREPSRNNFIFKYLCFFLFNIEFISMRKQLIIFLSFLSFFSINLSAKVWINEFMQSNIDELIDDLQEFPDSWIELYNDSDESVELKNWYISDNKDYKTAWKITKSAAIPAKSYQIIYCDKEENGLHTSFRLDSGKGGDIYIFNPEGKLEDSVLDIPKQPAPNISRGRIHDADKNWAYFVKATPNSKNEGVTSNVLLPSPVFSLSGGVYKTGQTLSLSLPEGTPEDISLSDIYYTLNGTEPTENSNSYSEELKISKITPVRAKIISSKYLQNRSVTQTYIIFSGNITLPVIAVNLDPDYLWNDDFGIYVKGSGKYGKTGNGRDDKVNWNNNWRRPMNVEYFPSQNERAVINQLGELRISGGWSRAHNLKSLILYANKRFGEKRYDYQLFSQKPNQEIKSFMLRNSGNDFGGSFFRDAAIQLFMGGRVDLDYQAYQPAIFYLNGEYYGILNLRERSTDDYVFANYNGLEDIDMFERVDKDPRRELKVGDWIAYNELMSKLSKSVDKIDFEEIERLVDVNEFMNFMILQTYVGNTDFPSNNFVMWRPRTPTGKWRYILKDTDFGLDDGRLDHNTILHYISNNRTDQDRTLFSALLSHEPFKTEFYSRFAIYMGDILSPRATSHVIDSIRHLVEPEMLRHRNRWHGTQNLNNWNAGVDQLINWCNKRNDNVYDHLRNYFNLSAVIPMKAKAQEKIEYNSGDIIINGIPIQNQGFDGKYFRNKGVNLRWNGDPKKVNAWTITATISGNETSTIYFDREINYLIPTECTDIQFTATYTDDTAMPVINKPNISFIQNNTNVTIKELQGKSVVSVFIVNGQLLYETTTLNDELNIPLKAKGVYFIRIQNKDQIITKKLVY